MRRPNLNNMDYIVDYNYRSLCLNEKMGVIARVFQEKEVYDISKIVNDFMNKIRKTPEEPVEDYYELLTQSFKIKYDPTTSNKENAKTNGTTVYLYLPLTNSNYFKVKYTLIHELIHVIQLWYNDEYDNMSHVERIKYHFRKPYSSKLSTLSPTSNYRKFIYLLYREDLYEISAWAHDAYIHAFLCKMQHQNMSNQQIVNIVLRNIFVNNDVLNTCIKNIKTSKRAYNVIMEILISHFSELDGNNGQRFFDKNIFELDIIKLIRKEVKLILKKFNNPSKVVRVIKHLIKEYNNQLLEVKDIIIDSYIKHLKYWYDKAIKQYGKAIQLGIDDASTKYNRKGYGSYNK